MPFGLEISDMVAKVDADTSPSDHITDEDHHCSCCSAQVAGTLECTVTTEGGDAALTSSLFSEVPISRSSSTASTTSIATEDANSAGDEKHRNPSAGVEAEHVTLPIKMTTIAPSTATTRRRRLVFVRHGESDTNVCGASVHVFDPSLTSRGRRQAQHAGRLITMNVSACSPATTLTVLTSPLSRALQTAQLAFLPDTTDATPLRPAQMIAVEDLREVVGKERIAELRRPCHALAAQYPLVDFSGLAAVSNEDPMASLAVDLTRRCAGPGERRHALQERAMRVWERLCSPDPRDSNTDPLDTTTELKCVTSSTSDDAGANNISEVVAVVSHYHLLTFLCRHLFDEAFATSASDVSVLNSLSCLDSNGALEDWPNGGVLTVECVFQHQGPGCRHQREWAITHVETSF